MASLATLCLLAAACGGDALADAPEPVPPPELVASAAAARPVVDRPVRVVIPAIDVDAEVMGLGLEDDGTLEVPEDPDVTGWFTEGPEPGEPGKAVIAGHLDSYTGPAVFHRLRDLERGDEITIHGDDGTIITFAVDSVSQYDKDNFPTDQVYGESSIPALRLITCGGGFDRQEKSYSDNLVVYAWPTD